MIEVNHLTKKFGVITAVDDISFYIPAGEIVGFLGPNGAGKTTTLRMLVGYLQPSFGTIRISEQDINTDPIGLARQIGYLPEQNPLYADLTVYDYLQFIAALRHMDEQTFRERLEFVLDKCGLRDVIGQPIQTLSKGYKQRTGLAQAILHDPQVLILDEPTSGLDPNQILEIRELIKELGKAKTVILSSHIMQEVQAVCDRIIIINKGKIIADEAKEELGKNLSGSVSLTIELEAENPDFSEWLELHPEVKLKECVPNEGHWKREFSYPAELDLQRDLAQFIASQKWLILSMYKQQHSLEEIFHLLTTESDMNELDKSETKEADNSPTALQIEEANEKEEDDNA